MKSIFCTFKDKNQALQAVEQLREANISNLSILSKSPKEGKQPQPQSRQRGMAEEEGSWEQEEPETSYRSQSPQQQKRPQGSKPGQQIPGLNNINVPGLGECLVSGVFQNLLRNPKGPNPIPNALTQLGLPENQATKISDKINKNNSILLCIQADSTSDLERAREILEDCNASDIAVSAEKAAAGKKSQQW